LKWEEKIRKISKARKLSLGQVVRKRIINQIQNKLITQLTINWLRTTLAPKKSQFQWKYR